MGSANIFDFSYYFSSLSLSSSLQPFTSRFPHLDVMIEDLNMNPTVAPPIPLPGQNVFRSSDNSYRCLECGCDQSFGAPESLKLARGTSSIRTQTAEYIRALPLP